MVLTWVLIMTLHFAGDKAWRGDADITMKFTCPATTAKPCDPADLCRQFRRAIWAQFQDANGDLGDCTPVTLQPTPQPTPEEKR